MNAPNLIYATVAGMYPRLLADDGVHEALVLPYDVDGFVPLEFYREANTTPLAIATIYSAEYLRPDGTVANLGYTTNPFVVRFESTLPAGGLCIITLSIIGSDDVHQCYPFRVLRPTESLTP